MCLSHFGLHLLLSDRKVYYNLRDKGHNKQLVISADRANGHSYLVCMLFDNIHVYRCHSYGLSLASMPFHTPGPDRQHGTLCRTAFALNQTLQSFGNILKLTFSVQHLTFVNFYSLILLSVDSVMHLCPFCNRRIINVR